MENLVKCYKWETIDGFNVVLHANRINQHWVDNQMFFGFSSEEEAEKALINYFERNPDLMGLELKLVTFYKIRR